MRVLMKPREPSLVLVFGLFFVSGITGLVYEVAWTRMFTVVFGNTVQAASTVLAAYMGGLALGSLLIGRRADWFSRPVLTYGALEVSIGLYVVVVPLIVGHLTGLYAAVFQAFGQQPLPVTALRFLLSFAVLLVPTTLMGATLPVLSKFAGREFSKIGTAIGSLYALNTFGAVAGSFLTGFVLLETIGVSRSLWLAASVGIAIGAVAIVAGRRCPESATAPDGSVAGERPDRAPAGQDLGAKEPRASALRPKEVPSGRAQDASSLDRYASHVVLISYAISGAAALAYEVLYTKVLIFSLGLTVHAFTIMLTTFLVGLAVGSFVTARFADRLRRPIVALAVVEMLIGATVFASIYFLGRLDLTHRYLAITDSGGSSLLRLRGADFLQSATVMLVPTLLMGAAFPIVARIYARRNVVSLSIGRLYFFNTAGAVAGSLLAGFLLVPWIGSARSIALFASVNIAVGVLLLSAVLRRRPWQYAAAVAVLGIVGATYLTNPAVFAKTFNIKQPGSQLLYFKEGASGTVTVHRYPDFDLLATDGVDVAGTSLMLRVTQKLQGHLPVLLARKTERVAQIGLGSGETLHILDLHNVGRIDGIEICKDVIPAARRFFSAINLGVFDRPNVHTIIMDGKNYVLLSKQQYDIIMTDSVYPGSGGASALYTYDHFLRVRDRLNPGGIASCWLPLDINKRDLRMALKAFSDVFPDMTVWFCYQALSQHALLVGRKDGDVRIDLGAFARAYADPTLRDDLSSILLDDPFALAAAFLADGSAVKKFCGDCEPNTDDHPILEFGIARRGISKSFLAENLRDLLALRPDPLRFVDNVSASGLDSAYVMDRLARSVAVSSSIIAGHIEFVSGEAGLARARYEEALAVDPGSRAAASCIAELDRQLNVLQVAAGNAGDYKTTYDLGVRNIAEGNFEAAAKQLEKARAMRPDLPDPYVSLGECYLRWGKPADAIKWFTRADEIKPGDDGIAFRIGMTYEQLGSRSEAREAYLRATAANPDNYEARNNLGNIYLAEGRIGEARAEFEKAVKTAPSKPHAIFNLGLTYAKEQRWPEAASSFREALDVAPTFYPACVSLGDALMATGDKTGAVAAWQRALQLKPDISGVKQRLQAAAAQR